MLLDYRHVDDRSTAASRVAVGSVASLDRPIGFAADGPSVVSGRTILSAGREERMQFSLDLAINVLGGSPATLDELLQTEGERWAT